MITAKNNILLFAPRNIETEKDIPRINQISGIASYSLTSTRLKSFNGSSSLVTLQAAAFHAMFDIKIIDLRRTQITELKNLLFLWNTVETLFLPECLTTIREGAFKNTYSLKLLVLFAKVTTIEKGAIDSCNALRRIIFFGSKNFSNIDIFTNLNSENLKVYITDSYKSSTFGFLPVDFNWYRQEFLSNSQTFSQKQYILSRNNYISFLTIILHI